MSPRASFFGWRVVAAAFVMAVFGWGLGFYGPPVYLETVQRARGWPLALVSGAVTLHFLVGAVVIANLPRLHRRFGLPSVTVVGAVLLALGVLGWSLARSPWQLYAATLLSGGGWPALGAAAVNAIVAPWFVTKRPAALGMAYNGASIGGVIFSPLWVALIGVMGFRDAALVVGAGMLLVIAALALLVLGRTPESMGQFPDGEAVLPAVHAAATAVAPAGRLARDRCFLTLSLGMALCLFAQIGLIEQLVSFLVPSLGVQGAGLAAGLSTAAAIAGRFAVGRFMDDATDRRIVAALSLLVQVAGCAVLLFARGDAALLLGGVVLIGLGIGNATSLPPLIAQREFPRAQSPRVVALIIAISQATYAFAPALFGLLRQLSSDPLLLAAAIAIQLAAVVAYLAGRGAHARRCG